MNENGKQKCPIVLSTYENIMFTPDTLTKGYVQFVLQPVCSYVQTIPSKT